MKNSIYIYYILLLLLIISRPNDAVAPNEVIRIAYMLLMVVPALFLGETWLPAVFTCIITVSQYGFSYSYLPSGYQYYVFILILAILFFRENDIRLRVPKTFVAIISLFFIVDLIASGKVGTSFLGALTVYLMTYFIKSDKQAEYKMSMAFVIASFTLSVMYILFRDKFLVDYSYASGLERAGWIDPNYFSMAIGMGAIVSTSKLYDRDVPLYEKIFHGATIITSFMSIALLASRGGLLAFGMSTLVFVLFSKGGKLFKIILAIAIFAFVIYLFNNQYFDLVLYRFEDDTEGGSGRLGIWESKLQTWINSGLISLLLGYGSIEGASMTGVYVGFHNDFLAMLIEFGIIGFILFVLLWCFPLFNVLKNRCNVINVSAFMLFLTIECCTLEPLTLGRIPFWMFFIYIILLSKKKNEIKAIT